MNLYRAKVSCYREEGHNRVVRIVRVILVQAESIQEVGPIAEKIADETANSQPWVDFKCLEVGRLKMPIELVATKSGLKELLVF